MIKTHVDKIIESFENTLTSVCCEVHSLGKKVLNLADNIDQIYAQISKRITLGNKKKLSYLFILTKIWLKLLSFTCRARTAIEHSSVKCRNPGHPHATC